MSTTHTCVGVQVYQARSLCCISKATARLLQIGSRFERHHQIFAGREGRLVRYLRQYFWVFQCVDTFFVHNRVNKSSTYRYAHSRRIITDTTNEKCQGIQYHISISTTMIEIYVSLFHFFLIWSFSQPER